MPKRNPNQTTMTFPSNLLHFLEPRENQFPRFDDDSHSELISEDNGNVLSIKGREIFLKLASESRTRNIGIIDSEKKTIWLERNRMKHLHRVTSSYGFNYQLLKLLPSVENVFLEDEKDKFLIPRDAILAGRFMHFKDSADKNEYEVQVFLSLTILKRYSIK